MVSLEFFYDTELKMHLDLAPPQVGSLRWLNHFLFSVRFENSQCVFAQR